MKELQDVKKKLKNYRRIRMEIVWKRGRRRRYCWERGVISFQVGNTVSLVTNLTYVESSARDRSVSLSAIVCPRSTGLSNSVRVIGGR